MSNPFVYYRMDSLSELRDVPALPVSALNWRKDLDLIRRFYARFGHTVDPDGFGPYVGSPLALLRDGGIVCFAIPLSFREGETEIGGVATVPEMRNKGFCKALLYEAAFRILREGKAATLTTEKDNLPMQRAAEAIGMKRL